MPEKLTVKICGLRDPAQARAVEEMGADMIGLVFAASPRRVSVEEAAAVSAALHRAAAVGVFVDTDPAEINRLAADAGITVAQLHGSEGPDVPGKLTIPCIKAFRVAGPGFIDEIRDWLSGLAGPAPPAIMLDACCPAAAGGTGKTFNWEYVAAARRAGAMDDLPPVILAGGLRPENVAAAVSIARPHGVDCSTGVESRRGVKDLRLVGQFIENALKPRPGDATQT